MSNTKIFVASFGSKKTESPQRETVIEIKIIQEEAGWEEHCYLAMTFIKQLKDFIAAFRQQNSNNKDLINVEEFWEWLKLNKYLGTNN